VRGYRYLVSQHTDSIISVFSNLRVIGFMHRATEYMGFFNKLLKIITDVYSVCCWINRLFQFLFRDV
jgi:hypothetical protein